MSPLHAIRLCTASALGTFAALLTPPASHAAPEVEHPDFTPEQVAFFSDEVRPILAANCFKCHGGERSDGHVSAKGGLQLISRRGLVIGGDHGPALDQDNPADSFLLKMISYSDPDHSMPPKSKLPDAHIATLTKWVEMKAPWTPDDIDTLGKLEEADPQTQINATTRAFWSHKPLERPAVPEVEDPAWGAHPIDAFIHRDLAAAGLTPNPPASKATLIRRAYYNLTGLAPSPEEVAAFIRDDSPDAWPRLIERLLASPHYGEKWARHWLDVVRYAESNGFERDSDKAEIWRYRDYVINAFNQDKPYDEFLREQIAGDELDQVTVESKIATGYHRLMQWDDEPVDRHQARYDVFDDIVRTTSEGVLAMTLGCARCHDHKGDPISQVDYYSFMAFFNGLTDHDKNRVIEDVVTPEMRADFERRRADLEAKSADARQRIAAIEKLARERFVRHDPQLAAQFDGGGVARVLVPDSRGDGAGHRWHFTTTKPDAAWSSVGFRAENAGWQLAPGGFGTAGTPNCNPRTRWDTSDIWLQTSFQLDDVPGALVLSLYHDEDVEIYLNGQQVHRAGGHLTNYAEIELGADAVGALQTGRNVVSVHCRQTGGGQFIDVGLRAPGRAAPDIAKLIEARGSEVFSADQLVTYRQLKADLQRWEQEVAAGAGSVRAMVVQEHGPQPRPLHVHIRGNANAPGDPVQPAFPKILDDADAATIPEPEPGAKTSGRRRVLAQWLTRPDNRRTSRVMANRIWQHHFGRGICRTSSDFGYLGERPTHPELLDWLATEFVARGWSIKDMHRLIMTSRAYQMSSAGNPEALAKDPVNDLFWRFDMRRLTAEEIRDSILALSGNLNLKLGGPSMYPTLDDVVLSTSSTKGGKWGNSPPEERNRRSIYIKIKRSLKPPELESFDFADTDAPCPVRFTTTVPTQALNMLNSRFVNDQAAVMAENLRAEAGADPAKQVRYGLQHALCRKATDAEVDHCLALLDKLQRDHGLDPDQALERFCLLVLNLNEFIYLD